MNMDYHNYRVKRALVQLLDAAIAMHRAVRVADGISDAAFEQRWLAAHKLTADDMEECRMTALRGESHDVVPGP